MGGRCIESIVDVTNHVHKKQENTYMTKKVVLIYCVATTPQAVAQLLGVVATQLHNMNHTVPHLDFGM